MVRVSLQQAPVWLFLLLLHHPLLAQERAQPVSTTTAWQDTVAEQVTLTGSVTSPRSSSISSKVEGYVDILEVEVGDTVEQGDVILELDRRLAEIELQRIRAQINEAVARNKELIRQRDEARELVAKRHVSQTAVKTAESEVVINSAVVERLKVELSRQKEIVARHTVTSPFTGVVTERMVEVGQWIETNTALIDLIEQDRLRIEVPVPQFYFSRIDVGTPVVITYDSIRGQEFPATVSIKVPFNQQNSRTFPVLIDVDNRARQIAAGMSARVTLLLDQQQQQQSLLIPADAIIKATDGSEKVWVVIEEQEQTTVKPVMVTTGRTMSGSIEILSGELSVGDQVIVKGNELLRPGQSVTIVETLDYRS